MFLAMGGGDSLLESSKFVHGSSTGIVSTQWRTQGRGSGGYSPPPLLKDKKIKSFVAFTLNWTPKSLKTYHFHNETSQFNFLGLKNTIFSKFCPRYARDFTFRPSLNKFLGAPLVATLDSRTQLLPSTLSRHHWKRQLFMGNSNVMRWRRSRISMREEANFC